MSCPDSASFHSYSLSGLSELKDAFLCAEPSSGLLLSLEQILDSFPWPPCSSSMVPPLSLSCRSLLYPQPFSLTSSLARSSLPQGLCACCFRCRKPVPRALPSSSWSFESRPREASPYHTTSIHPSSRPLSRSAFFSLHIILPEMHINQFLYVLTASSTRVVF